MIAPLRARASWANAGAVLALALGTLAVLAPATPAVAPAPAPVHSYRGVVPILCYHGIHVDPNPAADPYSIPQAEFARQIAMLAGDGFHAISIAQYARFAAGDVTGLPDRPILITFDDGRLDSYQGADSVLASYGMRATMFVITANAATPKPGYLGWAQLVQMAGSGRWDLQLHAHAGHVVIPTGPGNQTGPYYANLLYKNGARETFTALKRRVSNDILTGRRLMASRVPGFKPFAFAVPYSNYGQLRTNYAPIPAWELGWLERTFGVVFVEDRRIYNLPGSPVGQRYGIHASTTAPILHQWLAQALPRSAWTEPPPNQPAAPPARPKRPSLRSLRVGKHKVVITFNRRDDLKLQATRRRVHRKRHVRIKVSAGGRLRDRRLHPGTVYIYRVIAVDTAGNHSPALRLRVRTRSAHV